MDATTPGPYPRSVGGRGRGVPRPPGGRDSRPNSPIDDHMDPLGIASGQEEAVRPILRGMPDDRVQLPRDNRVENGWGFLARRIRPTSFRKILILSLTLVLISSGWFLSKVSRNPPIKATTIVDAYVPPIPVSPIGHVPYGVTEIQWIRENTFTNLKHLSTHQIQELVDTRPKAAFISLVRNEELEDMVFSILQVEARFNRRETHRYDWVFFNNEEFTDEFKAAVSKATTSKCYFERIPKENWSIPPWIDVTRFDVGRQFMGGIGVGKAWLQSYHHMCRWNAGIFAFEARLAEYDWFWRVEPSVQFYCNINYDVFRFMQDTNKSYGFNMVILDDARSFPSLWERTKAFIDGNEDLIAEDADWNWLLHTVEDSDDDVIRPHTGVKESMGDGEYNNCQFYSNFEIGSLNFFRSKEHRAYFNHLDKAGGFYYERFGDAPVHTLSVSIFLPKTQIWYFRDIGYAHGLCEQCPPHEYQLSPESESHRPFPREVEQDVEATMPGIYDADTLVVGPFESFGSKHRRWNTMAKDVERQKGIPGLMCGCTVSAIDSNNAKLVPYESKQRKPTDPCIRKFLGGEWLVRKKKMSDFNSGTGNFAGGDGPDYVLDGRDSNPFQ